MNQATTAMRYELSEPQLFSEISIVLRHSRFLGWVFVVIRPSVIDETSYPYYYSHEARQTKPTPTGNIINIHSNY